MLPAPCLPPDPTTDTGIATINAQITVDRHGFEIRLTALENVDLQHFRGDIQSINNVAHLFHRCRRRAQEKFETRGGNHFTGAEQWFDDWYDFLCRSILQLYGGNRSRLHGR